MEYINHMVGICVTEKGENVRMDIYWNQGRYMEKKTVKYRKEESALCDAALYGLLKRRTPYFQADERKDGGRYLTLIMRVKRIDEYQKRLVFTDRSWIRLEDLYEIELLSDS